MKKIIVIGAGHAGLEAANAISKMGNEAVLITLDSEHIAVTPCNPSIGGPAKGNIVREVDALGGLMGKVSDKTMIQIKKLNKSKGPAVQAIRAQIDKSKYSSVAKELLLKNDNLKIVEDLVTSLIIEDNKIIGVNTKNSEIRCDSVVITTGTYMDSYIIKGDEKISSGPDCQKTSTQLSSNLKDIGFNMFRLKTGTPARVSRSSIDFSNLEVSPGDHEHIKFSHFEDIDFDYDNQEDCYLIHTNKKTHDIILNNLDKSPITSGIIDGVGARYCPSIEDKLQRFSDKERHQIFLEPETRGGDSIYVQGFSTSMPDDIQDKMISSLPGMSNAKVISYGYAIEYEAIFPEQLKNTLESKKINNLFFAGQVNGTSGYEEAAGQGIIAGINASLKVNNKEPFILTRADSYIGLMIDDLVTKGTKEPYRLLTSRAEYRLHLRNDNADQRLLPKAYEIGMISADVYEKYNVKINKVKQLIDYSSETILSPKIITKEFADCLKTSPLKQGITLYDFIKRPNITFVSINHLVDLPVDDLEVFEVVETQIKYDGYIKKTFDEINRFSKNESLKLPLNLDYTKIKNLALEAREKLNKIKPETIGQASRISGINPADINVLLLAVKERKFND